MILRKLRSQRGHTKIRRLKTCQTMISAAVKSLALRGKDSQSAEFDPESEGLRENRTDGCEVKLRVAEVAVAEMAVLDAQMAAALREANERLVVATVRAQAMAEAAELATAQMAHMAEHDFLTGLPNRGLLMDRLSQAMVFAQRHGKRVALMYLDLDHFKHINDSLGHAVGDQLLRAVARRLQACVRSSDTVCRQGGDEFVVLLAEIGEVGDASYLAGKILTTMAAPFNISGHRLHITLSIGISLYPDDGRDIEAVMRNADTAMYHAKQSGRNCYQVFTPGMNVRAVQRQSIEVDLHSALEHQGFSLQYQPKVNLDSGALCGTEALLRLQSGNRHLVYPTQFISVAEECGLIVPIGRWVLREACRQAVAWQQAGLDFGVMAVNVSSVEFHHKDFLDGVRRILAETGLDPCRLVLEMTESGLMQDTERTTGVLHDLKNIGVKIAVDDFGTGYSSLSYLRRFPIDTLKIDQSFVHDIDSKLEDTDSAIVCAIIAMGHSLGQRVVAEGVETRAQLSFLHSHHCEEGQGFLFSHALSVDDFARFAQAGQKPASLLPSQE